MATISENNSSTPASRSANATMQVPDNRPSLWVVAAGLISLATFYIVINGHWMLLLLGAALLATQFTTVRLETRSPLRWLVRIALFGLVMLVTQAEPSNVDYLIGPAAFRNQVGMVYAAEMVVQAWRRRGDPGHVSLAVLLCSGLVYLTACNTFDDRFIWLVTPAYLICGIMTLLGHRRRGTNTNAERSSLQNRRRIIVPFMRVMAITLVLGIGLVSFRTVRVYKGELNDLGNRLIADRGWFDSSGMSSQPHLGSTFDLRGSPERVLRVKNLGSDVHLRGASFDTYEDGRWGPPVSPGARSFQKVTLNELSPSVLRKDGKAAHARQDMIITRFVSDNRLVFAPIGTVGLDPGEADDVEWAPSNGGPIRTRARPPYQYMVTVAGEERYQGPLATPKVPRSGEQRARFLQMPDTPDMKYIRALATDIFQRTHAKTPAQKVDAVVNYLLANHRYSLSTRVGPGDPVASFLREKKAAHCEFFAASATLLLRAGGVPARYVQGYYAHENEGKNTIIVRQRDAHAWTEVWLDGIGWAACDATPGDGRPDYKPDPVPVWRRASEWIQDHMQALRDLLADLPPIVLNLIVVAIAVLPLGYYVLRTQLVKRRRSVAAEMVRGEYSAPPADLAEAATRFAAALGRAGSPVPPERTWAEHLLTLPPALAEVAVPFTRAYDAARFGGHYDNETAALLGRLLDGIERAAVPADNAVVKEAI